MATGSGTIDAPIESKQEIQRENNATTGSINNPVECEVIQPKQGRGSCAKSQGEIKSESTKRMTETVCGEGSLLFSTHTDIPSHDDSSTARFLEHETNPTTEHDSSDTDSYDIVKKSEFGLPESPVNSSLKTIIILGKTGVGKVVIAQHILKNVSEKFTTLGSLDSVTREAKLILHDEIYFYDDETQPDPSKHLRVVIMDTNGLNGPRYNMKKILHSVENIGEVNAIFFVLKYGRVTIDDCKPFNDIIESFIHIGSEIHEISYLVVTGCEGMDKEGRDRMVHLYESDPITKHVCSFIKKVIPVGFPDLTSVIPALRPLFMAGIEEDQKVLRKIVEYSEKIYKVPKRESNETHSEFTCFLF